LELTDLILLALAAVAVIQLVLLVWLLARRPPGPEESSR